MAARKPTEKPAEEAPVTGENQAPAGESVAADPSANGVYVVVGAGVSYAAPENPAEIRLGLQNRVIELGDAEAERLLLLGVIRAASDEDRERESARLEQEKADKEADAAGPVSNPYGGSIVGGKTLEDHAREQIALAKANKG